MLMVIRKPEGLETSSQEKGTRTCPLKQRKTSLLARLLCAYSAKAWRYKLQDILLKLKPKQARFPKNATVQIALKSQNCRVFAKKNVSKKLPSVRLELTTFRL